MSVKLICDFCHQEADVNYYNNTFQYFTGRAPERLADKHLVMHISIPPFVRREACEINGETVEPPTYPPKPFDIILCEECVMKILREMVERYFSNKYFKKPKGTPKCRKKKKKPKKRKK